MFEILRKKALNPTVTLMDIYAPDIAKKAEPGQFIILRVDSEGERIHLTIADYNREDGTVTKRTQGKSFIPLSYLILFF